MAAAWCKPSEAEPTGVVQLNKNFGSFVETIEYWQEQYPDHMSDQVERAVHEVYGEAMVARIAHSESLMKDPNWGRKEVEKDLRSTAAMTMAVLGLVSEDQVISSRLSGSLGVKRKKSTHTETAK